MRATISFEIDVDQVEGTMGMLVAQEAHTLRAIADMIDVSPDPSTGVLDEVTEALRVLESTAVQLQQYRDMLVSLERARFETILPQPAGDPIPVRGQPINNLGDLQNTMSAMKNLQGFLDRINDQREEDVDDVPTDEEG